MDILWAQLVDGIETDPDDNRVLDYGLPVHILEYGGMPVQDGEQIAFPIPIVLLCKWGRVDAMSYGDIYYAASLTSPDHSAKLLTVEANGKREIYFPVTFPPGESEWFTYLRLTDILYRGDGCYRITISSARYGIPVHLSSSYIASVGLILRRRQDNGQNKQTAAAMYGSP